MMNRINVIANVSGRWNKSHLWLTTTLLLTSWLALSGALLIENPDWRHALFIALTLTLAIITVWLHHNVFPPGKMRTVSTLAQLIESRSELDHSPIVFENPPSEIQPIITAFNHLLDRERDRARQEHDFSTEASHELRTPLAGIRLQAQIAQRTQDPAQREKALSHILKAIDKSTHLVEQLLALSRLNHSDGSQEYSPIKLDEFCRQMAASVADEATRRHITLSVSSAIAPLHILAQEEHLKVFMHHVLHNALRYTPDHGRVEIHWFDSGQGNVALSVSDSGPGIAPEYYAQAMAPLQKVIDGNKRGPGLGLAIAQRVAEMHNTELSLDRASIGGLAVSLALPVA